MNEWPILLFVLIAITRRSNFYAMESLFAKKDISYTQYTLLTELLRLGGKTNQQTLSFGTYYDKSVVSRQLNNLEALGLVKKCPPEYPHKRMVALTDKGEEKGRFSFVQLSEAEKLGCAGLSKEEIEHFSIYLKKIYYNIAGEKLTLLLSDSIKGWPGIPHFIICIGKHIEQEGVRYEKIDRVPAGIKYILFQLMHENRAIPFKELEKVVMMEQSGTLKLINRLKKDGYVTILDDPEDKRKKLAKITDKGLLRAESYLKPFFEYEDMACHGLTKDQREEITHLLWVYYENTNDAFGQEFHKLLMKKLYN